MQKEKRPGIYMTIINRSPEASLNTGTGGGSSDDPSHEESVILTAEIRDGVFYLRQIPSAGGFTARISDGVFYLTPPPAGSNYTAEIQNDIFYLKEA